MNITTGLGDKSPEALRAFADEMAAQYNDGKTNLLLAGVAAFNAQEVASDTSAPSDLRLHYVGDEKLLTAARERAIRKLETSRFVSRAQRPLLLGVIELLSAAPSLQALQSGNEEPTRKNYNLPVLRQHVMLMPDLSRANYLLTLTAGKSFVTDERYEYNRPHLTLVENEYEDRNDVKMYYSQGMFALKTMEGIVIGSDKKRANLISDLVKPEKASGQLLADYQRFMDDATAHIDTL